MKEIETDARLLVYLDVVVYLLFHAIFYKLF